MTEVLYRGFDGLDLAMQGALPRDLVAQLDEAKTQAQTTRHAVLVTYGGVSFHVAETGAPNGYAFRCSTGDDGAIWFFKRGMSRADWNIRVSVRSMGLALYGLGGVRARLYEFLAAIGAEVGSVSISRVDYAVDLLIPGFTLDPACFVMHSHTDRQDRLAFDEMGIGGKAGRVTSVTVGHMPRRQVIVYDKRAEVIQKHKVHWWEIWNTGRRARGLPELDAKDRESSRVWRVEVRAGKDHLKDCWNIRTWADLDSKIGDVFAAVLRAVRYVEPNGDTNRSRRPNHSIWGIVARELGGDLFEMISGADPQRVKTVVRDHLKEILVKQMIGNAATLAVTCGLHGTEAMETLADSLKATLDSYMREEPDRFDEKLGRAAKRYHFITRFGSTA